MAWNTRRGAPNSAAQPGLPKHTARRHRLISHDSLALQMLLFWNFLFGYTIVFVYRNYPYIRRYT